MPIWRRHAERPLRAKLIFNPGSGAASAFPGLLVDITREMQSSNLAPELYLSEPDSDYAAMAREALKRDIRLFVVCGGDGTIDAVARALAGTEATLGIIPTGTQNNVALSLGIPNDIAAAVGTLREGRRIKVDMGQVTCGKVRQPFLEACSVGLFSALYPSADDIQHGKLTRISDLLATLIAAPPAEMRLVLDGRKRVRTIAHVALVCNMPFIGPHYQVGSHHSFEDGHLDVVLFADLSKLQLLGYAVQNFTVGPPDDVRIQRYRARRVTIETAPPVPVTVDGVSLEPHALHVEVRRHALAVLAGADAGARAHEGQLEAAGV